MQAAGCPASHRMVNCYHNGSFKMVCLGCFPHMAEYQHQTTIRDGANDKAMAVDAALSKLSAAVEELRNALKR